MFKKTALVHLMSFKGFVSGVTPSIDLLIIQQPYYGKPFVVLQRKVAYNA